ncbi:MAG: glycosyltransferase [Planctomycetota bacterium]
MKVLFCGAWDEGCGYPRAAALRQGLRHAGVEVDECRMAPVAGGRQKQRLLRQPWRWPGFVVRTALQRVRLRRQLRRALGERRPEVVVVPYPGHQLIETVARTARVPVVLDLFLSAYDTAVTDRGLVAADSVSARMLRALDRRACGAADLVLVDTEENATFVAELTGIAKEHFAAVAVGDPDAPATPAPYAQPAPGALPLLFFGTGVPLHGLTTLLEAVARAPAVTLTLIGGTADERAQAQRLLGARLRLLPEFVARPQLQAELDRAALVAGVFGTGPKAARVVPFKVVHALASGRPVITADTPAARAALGDGAPAFLVPAGDAPALAARLQELARQPELLGAAAARARAVHDRCFSTQASGAQLRALLADLVATGSRR